MESTVFECVFSTCLHTVDAGNHCVIQNLVKRGLHRTPQQALRLPALAWVHIYQTHFSGFCNYMMTKTFF